MKFIWIALFVMIGSMHLVYANNPQDYKVKYKVRIKIESLRPYEQFGYSIDDMQIDIHPYISGGDYSYSYEEIRTTHPIIYQRTKEMMLLAECELIWVNFLYSCRSDITGDQIYYGSVNQRIDWPVGVCNSVTLLGRRGEFVVNSSFPQIYDMKLEITFIPESFLLREPNQRVISPNTLIHLYPRISIKNRYTTSYYLEYYRNDVKKWQRLSDRESFSGLSVCGDDFPDYPSLMKANNNVLKVRLAVPFEEQWVYSEIMTCDMQIDAPEIKTDKIVCKNPVCWDGNEGSIQVPLKRSLYAGEELVVALNHSNGIDQTVKTFRGVTQILKFDKLKAGEYKLRFTQGSYNGVRTTIPDEEITFVLQDTASRIDYTVSPVDIKCKGAYDGAVLFDIKRNNQAATDFFQAVAGNREYSVIDNRVSRLPAGRYLFKLKDHQGCYAKDDQGKIREYTVNLTEPQEALNVRVESFKHPSSLGAKDGEVVLASSGGTGVHTYFLQDKSVHYEIFDLKAGNYNFRATDENGCTAYTGDLRLLDPVTPVIKCSKSISCYNISDGEVAMSECAGGTGIYTLFKWERLEGADFVVCGEGGEDFKGDLPAGVYRLRVEDDEGHFGYSNRVELQNPKELILAGHQVSHPRTYGGNQGFATVTVSGGTGEYSYYLNGAKKSHPFEGLVAGEYTYHVADKNNCRSTTGSFQLWDPVTPTIKILEKIHCFDGSNGKIEIENCLGGTGVYHSYEWEKSVSDENYIFLSTGPDFIKDLSAGKYRLKVTDDRGNSGVSNVLSLENPAKLKVEVVSLTLPDSCGKDNGKVSLTGFNGSPPYTYFLHGEEFAEKDISGLQAGTYDYWIRDSKGCLSDTNAFELPDPLKCSARVRKEVTCQGYSDGVVEVTVCGGSKAYTYQWYMKNNPYVFKNQGVILENIPSGTYKVVVADDHGNSCEDEITLLEPPVREPILSIIHPGCYGAANGEVRVDEQENVTGYTYRLNGGEFISENMFKHLPAGEYSIAVKDPDGCIHESSATLVYPPKLSLSVQTGLPSPHDAANGWVRYEPSGGTPPYFYQGIEVSEVILSGLTAGKDYYKAVIYDKNHCPIEDSARLVCPLTAKINLADSISCYGKADGKLKVVITGGLSPYKIKWYRNTDSEYVAAGEYAGGLKAGVYRVEVTDDEGNIKEDTLDLREPDILFSDIMVKHVSCKDADDGNIEVQVSGGTQPYNCQWSQDENLSSLTAENLEPGTYTCRITDRRGCYRGHTVTVTEPDRLSIRHEVTFPSVYGAEDGAIMVEVTGGTTPYRYLWNYKDAEQAGINGLSASGIPFVVKVTDANGCVAIDTSWVYDPVTVALEESGVVICSGQETAELTAHVKGGVGGPYRYSWWKVIDEELQFPLLTADSILPRIGVGCYRVEVTDVKNHTGWSEDYTIYSPDSMRLNPVIKDLLCKYDTTGQIELFPSGGEKPYRIEWNDGEMDIVKKNLREGRYEVTFTDARGCQVTGNLLVKSPEELQLESGYIEPRGWKRSDGMAWVIAIGGTEPYRYDWGAGIGEDTLFNVGAGIYTVVVSDRNGCKKSVSLDVSEPPLLESRVIYADTIRCFGASDGRLKAGATGGVGSYIYSWFRIDGQKVDSIASGKYCENIPAGIYRLKVTDENGISAFSTDFNVITPDKLVLRTTLSDTLCYGESTGLIGLEIQGGSAPFTINWENGMSGDFIYNLPEGEYRVAVTDKYGCFISKEYRLEQHVPVVIELGEDLTLCRDQVYRMEPVTRNDLVSYNWYHNGDPLSTESMIHVADKGVYTLEVRDIHQCEGQDEVTVYKSDQEIAVNFAVSAEVEIGTILKLVNTSFPFPDSSEWLIPDSGNVFVISKSPEMAEVIIDTGGHFTFGLRTTVGACEALLYKTVYAVQESDIPPAIHGLGRLIEEALVFPNPNNGKFNVKIRLREKGSGVLNLYSPSGNLLYRKPFGNSDQYEIEYNEFLPTGIYVLQVVCGREKEAIKILIK